MAQLKTALIGCGMRGPAHADVAAQSENYDLVAVCDLDPERAKAAGERFGVEAYTDHQELLRRDGLDVVLIGTHTRHHASVAMDTVAAGKHFIMEKPMVDTVEAGQALCDAARKAGVVGTIGYQNRFVPFTETIKSRVEQIDVVQVLWTRQRGYMNPQYFFPEHYGGIIDTLSHEFDLVLWFLGWAPTAVYAQVHRGAFQPDDNAIEFVDVAIECEKDGRKRTAIVSGSLAAVQPRNVHQLVGRRGCIWSSDRSELTVVTHEGFGDDKKPIHMHSETIQAGGGMKESLLRLYDDFADALRAGREPRITLEAALLSTAVSQYAAESAESGERIRIAL